MKAVSVLFLLFPNFNTLDLNGPWETLAQANGYSVFNNTIASATELTTAAEKISIKRDIDFSQAMATLPDYDVLVVPGGRPDGVMVAIEEQKEMMDVIAAYSKLTTPAVTPSDVDTRGNMSATGSCDYRSCERVLLSICTGAGFLGAKGVLAGRKATTHWSFLEDLKNITAKFAAGDSSKATDVVGARFVDSGLNENGVRIITAGGVSSGIDAALYLVMKKAGNETANFSARIMDYSWRLKEGIVV